MNRILALSFLALAVAASSAVAGLYDSPATMRGWISREAGFYGSDGGEFTMRELSPAPMTNKIVTGTYSDSAPVGGFQTFCLEHDEQVSVPGKYYFDVTTYTTGAGGGGIGSAGPGGAPTDELDPRTAYLYTKFRSGDLMAAGYNYNAGAGRDGANGSAYQLQKAIWAIEDEQAIPSSGLAKQFYLMANAAVAPGGEWFNKGLGNVRVLNLWGDANRTQFKQDQLVMVPAPGAVLLGAFGLGLVNWARRRMQ
jgi:hypothetical protein